MLMRDNIPTALNRGSALLSEDPIATASLKTFHHTFDIYLKDSNAFMNTYFLTLLRVARCLPRAVVS